MEKDLRRIENGTRSAVDVDSPRRVEEIESARWLCGSLGVWEIIVKVDTSLEQGWLKQ